MIKLVHLSVLISIAAIGCDRDANYVVEKYAPDDEGEVTKFEAAPAEPLVKPDASLAELKLTVADRFPECHEFLDPAGDFATEFPFPDPDERALKLIGCEIEGYHVADDGTRLIAWGTPEELGSRRRDMRFAAFNADGTPRWNVTISRAAQGANYVANYRTGFIVPLAPRLACAGTLWEGSTQVACVDWTTGAQKWDGSLKFWSGIVPRPWEDGFVLADLSSLTKRYPFSGAEMRYKKLDGIGGRAGFYAATDERLYFAASRSEKTTLVAYDFATWAAKWRVELPAPPAAGFSHAFGDLGVVMLKLEDTIYALAADSGKVIWSRTVDADLPAVAVVGNTLLFLWRRPSDPNLLVAVEPKTGAVKWAAETPAGTLRVAVVDGVVVLKSVRAVQRVVNIDAEGALVDE